MAANPDRGELDIELGKVRKTIRFRAAELMLLEDRLRSGPLEFVATGATTKFIVEAIFCGLSKLDRKVTPNMVAGWLDDADQVNRQELVKDILYAIARGKTGDESREMVEALDEVFGAIPTKGASAPQTGSSSTGLPGATT